MIHFVIGGSITNLKMTWWRGSRLQGRASMCGVNLGWWMCISACHGSCSWGMIYASFLRHVLKRLGSKRLVGANLSGSNERGCWANSVSHRVGVLQLEKVQKVVTGLEDNNLKDHLSKALSSANKSFDFFYAVLDPSMDERRMCEFMTRVEKVSGSATPSSSDQSQSSTKAQQRDNV